MPRVRLPNASLIASADLPILPFLAPRVFAEPPVSRRGKLQHGKSGGAQKEKEAAVLGTTQCHSGAQGYRSSYGSGACLQTRGQRWKDSKRPHRPSPIHILYADISSLTRLQARSHSTTRSAVRRVAGRTRLSHPKDRKIRPAHTSSVLVQNGPRLAANRQKALALERERLSNYVSRLPPGLSVKERMKQGQYRSLLRRISNLQRWDVTQLDLRRIISGSSNRSGLIRAFAALDRSLYSFLGRHTRKITIKHDPRCVRWSAKLFPPATKVGSHQVWTKWMEFDIATRKTAFQRLLIYLLDRKPGRALRFIQALANDPILRGMKTEALADALGHLSKIHCKGFYAANQGWGIDPEANKRIFVPAFVHIFQTTLAGRPDICSQDLLYNMAVLAGTNDLKKVFDCLVKNRVRLGFDTFLHYATAFGEAGEPQYALRCLDKLRTGMNTIAWESVVGRERLRWVCALILRKSMSKSQNYHETPDIVASFVHLGIQMDILLYNVVMHNAMEAGDYAIAFKVYNTLEGNGLKPDTRTYSILLHGCASQNNPAMFNQFAEYCAEVAKAAKDPWLATDYLYYLYVCHQNDPDPGHTLALLWKAYLNFFPVTPLEPLISHGRRELRDYADKQRLLPESAVLKPPPISLYIMLQMEIKSALAVSNQRVLNLYQQFKLLATEGGNTDLKTLAQNPTIWNAFLLAFCQKQQFANASQLIKDMTDGSTQPNVYSWNIFMQAFFKTGQVQAADRVFEIMRSRGVDPDQYTYGVLLRGYAKAQLIKRIGDTMQHVDTEQEMDPDLLRALATVINRKQLMYTLEKSRVDKEARAQEKAERQAEEERLRWELPQFTPTLPRVPFTTTTANEGVSTESRTTIHEPQKLSNPSREQTIDYQAPAIDNQEAELDDEETFSFLQQEQSTISPSSPPVPQELSPILPEPSPVAQEPSNFFPEPAEPTRPTQESHDSPSVLSTSEKFNRYDPELRYQMLQKQLGIIPPTSRSGLPDKGQVPPTKQTDSFGANLGFKSMLPNDQSRPKISKELPEFNVRKVLQRDTRRSDRAGKGLTPSSNDPGT